MESQLAASLAVMHCPDINMPAGLVFALSPEATHSVRARSARQSEHCVPDAQAGAGVGVGVGVGACADLAAADGGSGTSAACLGSRTPEAAPT